VPGILDFTTLEKAANQINPDLPFLVKHLESEEEYHLSTEYLRAVARDCGELL